MLKMNYADNMKLTRVRLCGPEFSVDGLQGFISDGFSTIPLTPIGNLIFNCVDWDLDEKRWITSLLVSYSANRMKFIRLSTNKFTNFEHGQQHLNDSFNMVEFDQFDKIVGFQGYTNQGIETLGYIRYKCSPKPFNKDWFLEEL